MYNVIRSVDLELRPGGTVKFEGAPYGSEASFFHVKNEPGTGSTLHLHPYPETWIVRTGNVRLTVGGEDIEAAGPATSSWPDQRFPISISISEPTCWTCSASTRLLE